MPLGDAGILVDEWQLTPHVCGRFDCRSHAAPGVLMYGVIVRFGDGPRRSDESPGLRWFCAALCYLKRCCLRLSTAL